MGGFLVLIIFGALDRWQDTTAAPQHAGVCFSEEQNTPTVLDSSPGSRLYTSLLTQYDI
jgi:hypothetical protein